jgi:hypothetical protein
MKASEFLRSKGYEEQPKQKKSAKDFLLEKERSTPFRREDFPQLEGPPWEEATKTALPLALDIAGGLVAPQLAIPHGLGTAATLLRKGGNLASRMAGSGAGAGLGEYARQTLSGEELDPATAGKEALIGAGGEVLSSPLLKTGKALAKPLFPLFSKITFAGQGLSKHLSNKLVEKTVNRANDFLYDLAPQTVKKQAVDIDDIALKLEKGKEEIGDIYDAYKAPLRELSKEGKFLTVNTESYLSFLKQKYRVSYPSLTEKQLAMRLLSEEFGYAPGGQYGKQLRKILDTGDAPTSDDFMWMLDHVFREKPKSGGSFLKATPTQQEGRRALKKAYLMDMDEAAGTTKGQADKLYMEYRDFLDIKKIFDRSMKDSGLGTQTVDPYKLSKNIYMNKASIVKIDEKRVKAGLEPFWPKMEEEAKYYTELVPYFKQAVSNIGVRPGMMGSAGSLASAIASGGTPVAANVGAYSLFGAMGIPMVEGFGAISAYSLLSPAGKKAIQIVAKHGTKSTLKTSLHIGGRLVDFPQDIGFGK